MSFKFAVGKTECLWDFFSNEKRNWHGCYGYSIANKSGLKFVLKRIGIVYLFVGTHGELWYPHLKQAHLFLSALKFRQNAEKKYRHKSKKCHADEGYRLTHVRRWGVHTYTRTQVRGTHLHTYTGEGYTLTHVHRWGVGVYISMCVLSLFMSIYHVI